MIDLANQLKKVLASTFCMYLKVHSFHWNVEGPNFPQYHSFFDSLYNELWSSVDPIAEHIRAVGAYAPGGLERFKELSVVADAPLEIITPAAMFETLKKDNMAVLTELTHAYKLAETANQAGLSNFLQDRIDIHNKHGWMLNSISK